MTGVAATPVQNGMSPIPAQAQAQMQMLQQQSMSSSMQPVLPTPTKKWYGESTPFFPREDAPDSPTDHVADRLLGDDPCKFGDAALAVGAKLTPSSPSFTDKVRVGVRRMFPPQRIGGRQGGMGEHECVSLAILSNIS